jgi:hypothetical protein
MRLGDTENCPNEAITPYQEFSVDNKTYYFTPGGFLYRKDPGDLTPFSVPAAMRVRLPILAPF